MKVNCFCFFITFLFSINAFGQIWIDDFDGSNTVPFNINLECGPDNQDYFGIACCGSGCGSIEAPALFCAIYGGLSGNFIGANNTDSGNAGCDANDDNETIEWTGIDISSCSGPDKLFLCFDAANLYVPIGQFATCNGEPNNGGWDGPSSVTFTGTIDNGTPITLVAIEDQGTNSAPAFDTDCNGSGDSFQLTNTMTQYCIGIPGSGNSLDLPHQYKRPKSMLRRYCNGQCLCLL